MQYEYRALTTWPYPPTDDRRGAHVFKATWADTLALLECEAGEWLGAKTIILEADLKPRDIRGDGLPRADARIGGQHPGVRISFESAYGPLQYATDAHEYLGWGKLEGWQANVRAIALALVALRAVDRYGVSRSGEQYRGWTQLDSRPAPMDRATAAEFISTWSGDSGEKRVATAAQILADPEALKRAHRAAARRVSPETHNGGDGYDTLTRLNVARDIVAAG